MLSSLPQPTPHSGSGPGSSSSHPVTVPGVTLPAQPALRHPVPPLESTGRAVANPASVAAAAPDPPRSPGPPSLPLAPRQRGTFGRSVSSLGASESPARPAICSRLGSGKEETQGGPAKAGGSRGDMGSAEEDYNFVFKGESCARCDPPSSPKGVEQKARSCGEGTRVPFPQSCCVPSWDVVDYPGSCDGHREPRSVRGLGSRHRPLTAVRPGLVSGTRVHRGPGRSTLTPRLQV